MKKSNWWIPTIILILLLASLACRAAESWTIPDQDPEYNSFPLPVEESAPDGIQGTALPPVDSDLLASYQGALERVYQVVNPSVVNLQVILDTSGIYGFELPEGQELPEGHPTPNPEDFFSGGTGSGFIWDKEGHIVTNRHVIAGAREIVVIFPDGRRTTGELVGEDINTDLAVIRVDIAEDRLSPVVLGDSSSVRVGQLAIAIGNPFGLSGSMTVGVVSALGRDLPVQTGLVSGSTYSIPDVIQTDAPINPGNSGGVLVDIDGRVIGVTTAIESPVQANAGIGFAVPSAIIAKVVPSLIENGSYAHAWLGFRGTELSAELAEVKGLSPEIRGAVVLDVTNGGPANQAGLQGNLEEVEIDGISVPVGGDVITGIDALPVTNMLDIISYLARATEPGQTITLTILREGEEMQIDVVLGTRPEE